jgi:excinuclease ABC subunit A
LQLRGTIRVRGAHEHNLGGVDIDLPLGKLIVVTGVSGSGKSSFAFDTLHAESQRRYVEALGVSLPGVDGGLRRPDVDRIDGLPPSIALHQRPRAPGPWDTVGSLAGVEGALGTLWARGGVLHCPQCDSPLRSWSHDAVVRELLALPGGSRLFLEAPVRAETPAAILQEVARAGFSRVRVGDRVVRLDELVPASVDAPVRIVVDRVRVSVEREARLHDAVRTAWAAGGGRMVAVVSGAPERWFSELPWCAACDRTLPRLRERLLSRRSPDGGCAVCAGKGRVDAGRCGSCAGLGLNEVARAVRWNGRRYDTALTATLAVSAGWLSTQAPQATTHGVQEELGLRLSQLLRLGLGRLAPCTRVDSIASGERQRLRLARQVAARLSGALYVLDEPTAGLHPDDVRGVVAVMEGLVEHGNTVVVVEHDPQVIASADEVVDFGPGAGPAGGHVVFHGPPAELREADTETGRWLSGRARIPLSRSRSGNGAVVFEGLTHRGLHELDLTLPLGALVSLVGPSGSGKSAVLDAVLGHAADQLGFAGPPAPPTRQLSGLADLRRVVLVEEGAGRSSRSSPATYSGLWTIMRSLLAATQEARVRGLPPSAFSLNVKGGRCEACGGTGVRQVEVELFADVALPCGVCDGRRFMADVLQIRWKGHAADELLALTGDQAHVLLAGHPKLEAILRALRDVGLGYVPLGLSTDALSGGEANRLKLARELARARRGSAEGVLYVLDHPSRGLHPADVDRLVALLQLLVDEGASVWMATHDPALVAAADHVVALPRSVPVENSAD